MYAQGGRAVRPRGQQAILGMHGGQPARRLACRRAWPAGLTCRTHTRSVKGGQDRLREAAKLGFQKAIIPRANLPKAKIQNLEVLPVERVDQAVQLLRNL